METLDTLARRMGTAEDLRDLVRTMKSLAAVSIRQYERSILALEDYDRTVELGLRAVLRGGVPPRSVRPPLQGRAVTIVLGSDQGLCGAFNEQVVGHALAALDAALDAGPQRAVRPRLLVVGGRAAARLEEAGWTPDRQLGVAASATLLPVVVEELLLELDRWRADGDLTEVVLHGNRPAGTVACRPVRHQLLPLPADRWRQLRDEPWPTRMVPRRTVDRAVLLGALARHALFVSLHRALAWSSASEHLSRLLAMQAAERNIDERLEELRGAYHTRRQTAITTEVLDIVSGAEAASA
jgi:F-type H+-transporting ATPase subunit gamma